MKLISLILCLQANGAANVLADCSGFRFLKRSLYSFIHIHIHTHILYIYIYIWVIKNYLYVDFLEKHENTLNFTGCTFIHLWMKLTLKGLLTKWWMTAVNDDGYGDYLGWNNHTSKRKKRHSSIFRYKTNSPKHCRYFWFIIIFSVRFSLTTCPHAATHPLRNQPIKTAIHVGGHHSITPLGSH